MPQSEKRTDSGGETEQSVGLLPGCHPSLLAFLTAIIDLLAALVTAFVVSKRATIPVGVVAGFCVGFGVGFSWWLLTSSKEPIRRARETALKVIQSKKLLFPLILLLFFGNVIQLYERSAFPWPLDRHQDMDIIDRVKEGCVYLGLPSPLTAAEFLQLAREQMPESLFAPLLSDPERGCVRFDHPFEMRRPLEDSKVLDYDVEGCLKRAQAVIDLDNTFADEGSARLVFLFPPAENVKCDAVYFEIDYRVEEKVLHVSDIRWIPQH